MVDMKLVMNFNYCSDGANHRGGEMRFLSRGYSNQDSFIQMEIWSLDLRREWVASGLKSPPPPPSPPLPSVSWLNRLLTLRSVHFLLKWCHIRAFSGNGGFFFLFLIKARGHSDNIFVHLILRWRILILCLCNQIVSLRNWQLMCVTKP